MDQIISVLRSISCCSFTCSEEEKFSELFLALAHFLQVVIRHQRVIFELSTSVEKWRLAQLSSMLRVIIKYFSKISSFRLLSLDRETSEEEKSVDRYRRCVFCRAEKGKCTKCSGSYPMKNETSDETKRARTSEKKRETDSKKSISFVSIGRKKKKFVRIDFVVVDTLVKTAFESFTQKYDFL